MTSRQRSIVKVLIVLCVPVLIPSPAFAGRVGAIWVQRDGEPLLWGTAGDDGSPPPAVVWRYLAERELRPADGVEITPDSSDPLQATLRGKITIDVENGGRAEVTELRLVRRATDNGWTMDPEQVERIAKDIGLGEVPVVKPKPRPSVRTAPNRISWLWVVGSAAAVLLVAGAVLLLRGRKGAHRA